MIIDYDHNPNITTDQKVQSLQESVQMALNENDTEHRGFRALIDKVNAAISSIQESLAKILNSITTATIADISYHASTSWQNIGTVTFNKNGFYLITASWANGAPLALALSSSSGNSPAEIINESSSGGTRSGIVYKGAGTVNKVWVKCATSSTANNYVTVRRILTD